MALDQSALIEVLDALKAAEVDDRIRQAAQTRSSSLLRTAARSPQGRAHEQPTILTVDDDPQVSAAIARDLASQYGADYCIVRATSGPNDLAAPGRLIVLSRGQAAVARRSAG